MARKGRSDSAKGDKGPRPGTGGASEPLEDSSRFVAAVPLVEASTPEAALARGSTSSSEGSSSSPADPSKSEGGSPKAQQRPGSSSSVGSPAAGGTYTVLARRYRPQQFADLIGQEHVAQALVQALESGRVAHAYLFTGARGVGKTSTARILAKALNCVRGPTPYPCDACDICRAIATGDDVDVVEIDGASNRGIEDARDLRQSVGFRPVRARYKIFIIDEVHMLTREAFNALLKTLEEPPPHVKFLFATTEVQKIPITILSRCQRFDFAYVRPAQIAEHLRRIVQQEGREAELPALQLIARKAAGSMRDAQSLLDQLLAAESGCLTVQRVRQVLGLSSEEQVLQLAEAVFRRDAATALQLLQQWYDQGLQAGELIDQLIAHWRNLMLLQCGGGEVRELPMDPTALDQLRQQAAQVSLDTILAGLDVWTTVKARLRDAYQAQVLLEMAVVRLARMDELLSVGALWQLVTQGGQAAAGQNPPAASSRAAPRGTPGASGGGSPSPSGGSSPPAEPGSGAKKNDRAAAPSLLPPIPLTPQTVEQIWSECLRRLMDRFPLLAHYLQQALPPAISGPNTLVIRFPAPYNLAYEACSQNEHFGRRLEETLQAVTGQPLRVRYERVALPARGEQASEVHTQCTSVSTAAAAPSRQLSGGDPRRPWLNWPLVRKALETLDAQIIRVDEGFQPRPVRASSASQRPSDDEEPSPSLENSEPNDEDQGCSKNSVN
jgi:DNA polymerase-3 subunit gamma/tau